MKTFKSKKELVALVVSAVVFGIVIYKMYLSKGKPEPEAARPAPAAPAAASPAPQPAPGPTAQTPADTGPAAATPTAAQAIAWLDLLDAEIADADQAPARLPRDPFTMSAEMREELDRGKGEKAPQVDKSPRLVTVTAKTAKEVLRGIPGAHQAAEAGLQLDAVMTSGSWKGAVVNGKVVQLGAVVLGLTLIEVHDDSVVLEVENHRIRLRMRSTEP